MGSKTEPSEELLSALDDAFWGDDDDDIYQEPKRVKKASSEREKAKRPISEKQTVKRTVKQAEKPLSKPVEKSAEEPTKKPAKKPVEKPAKKPAKKSDESTSEKTDVRRKVKSKKADTAEPKKSTAAKKKRRKRSRITPGSLFAHVVSSIILVGLLLIILVGVVPRLMGYQIYGVMTESMEPEIPAGSAVYVKAEDPKSLNVGDVITYGSANSAVPTTHRIIATDMINETVRTKGDANGSEDPMPVSYSSILGKVNYAIAHLGTLLTSLSTLSGKIVLVMFAIAAIMLQAI